MCQSIRDLETPRRNAHNFGMPDATDAGNTERPYPQTRNSFHPSLNERACTRLVDDRRF